MDTTADIPLAAGLRRIVDVALDAVRLGVRRFWRGGMHANAPAGESVSLLNRLMKLLRFTFVLLAVHLDLKPLGAAPTKRVPARAPAVRLRRPAFPLFAPYAVRFDTQPKGVAPAAFAAPRDRSLVIRRKLDALSRALHDPMPFIRRMARRLPTRLMVFGWTPPKRPPRQREYYEELRMVFAEAKSALSDWRRRTFSTAAPASGS